MSLVKGPFDLEWNGAVLAGIDDISPSYDIASNDIETVQGNTYTVYGAHKASVEATFVETDVPSLAAVLPQYKVDNGDTLSTGETVTDPNGAMDIVPGGCDVSPIKSSLLITSCGNPGQVARLVNATSEFVGFSHDSGIRKVTVRFTGTPEPGQATLQFFKDGAVSGVS